MSRLSSGPRKNIGHFSQPHIFVQPAFLQAHGDADPAHLKPIKDILHKYHGTETHLHSYNHTGLL